jgi:two-component system sensor histidine kinase/response regulator
VERWAPLAGKSRVIETAAGGTQIAPTANSPAQAASAGAPPEETPVDMGRLLDFTDGDPVNLRELVTLYLDQTSQQLEQLEAAVGAGAAQEVRRLAHSCAGASATCGIRRLVPLLRELERQGCEGKLTNAVQLSRQAGEEFGRVRHFLEAYLAEHSLLDAKP